MPNATRLRHWERDSQCLENICSENDLRSRILGAFVVKFRACLPGPCGFRPFDFYSKFKIEKLKIHNRDFQCLIPQELKITNLQSQLSILVSKKHKIENVFSIFNFLFHRFQLITNSNLTKLFMCNETVKNSNNDCENRNENRSLIFVFQKKKIENRPNITVTGGGSVWFSSI